MLESAGIPLPGETILILATVTAKTEHTLSIFLIGVLAAAGAIVGDNIGYAVGRKGGRRLLMRYRKLFHISEEDLRKGESLMRRRGPLAVYFARFITYLRIFAGPLAGVLHMDWRSFLLYNALGGLSWVALVTTLSYLFGSGFMTILDHGVWVIVASLGLWALYFWWKHRRHALSTRMTEGVSKRSTRS
jgi:membrane protein DedA with SNARE-associated domain